MSQVYFLRLARFTPSLLWNSFLVDATWVLIQRCGFMWELPHVWAVGNKSSHVFETGITRAHLEFSCPDHCEKKQKKTHAKVIIKVLHSYWKWSPCVGRQQWQPDNSGFVSNTSFIGSYRVSELHNPHCDSSSLFCGRRDGIPEEDTASTSSSTHSGEGDDLPAWPSYHLFMLWRLISNVHLSRKNR